jgi:hypothetical protein
MDLNNFLVATALTTFLETEPFINSSGGDVTVAFYF